MSAYICWECETKIDISPHGDATGTRFIDGDTCPVCGEEGIEYL